MNSAGLLKFAPDRRWRLENLARGGLLTIGFKSLTLAGMATETFSDEEFDQLEREVASIFFPRPADEVEDSKDSRIASILCRVEQGSGPEDDEFA